MASGTKASVAIGKEVLERLKDKFDRLGSLEAQVIRMRYGIGEAPQTQVGRPANDLPESMVAELETAEQDVLARLRDAGKSSEHSEVKGKIINSLKKH